MNPSALAVATAFAAVYLIWGSTYLAILIAIETLPPFTMAGVRFIVAGMLLYVWTRTWRVVPPATLRQWRSALIVGGFLLLGGNGSVVWAEQVVPSGITSLIVATVPLWLVLFHWAQRGGVRPVVAEVAGVVLGFVGLFILVDPLAAPGAQPIHRGGVAVLLFATVSWSLGSLYSRRADRPASTLLSAAMEMLCGGILLTLVGLAAGEWGRIGVGAISLRSLTALVYLIVFGSLIGFTAYMWLLRVTTPARVATYAYVNPVVAMLLGWTIAGEPLTPRTLLAMTVILGAVAVIITYGRGVGGVKPVAALPAETRDARVSADAAPVQPEAPREARHPRAETLAWASGAASSREPVVECRPGEGGSAHQASE